MEAQKGFHLTWVKAKSSTPFASSPFGFKKLNPCLPISWRKASFKPEKNRKTDFFFFKTLCMCKVPPISHSPQFIILKWCHSLTGLFSMLSNQHLFLVHPLRGTGGFPAVGQRFQIWTWRGVCVLTCLTTNSKKPCPSRKSYHRISNIRKRDKESEWH